MNVKRILSDNKQVYEHTVALDHNEGLAKIDMNTGMITDLSDNSNTQTSKHDDMIVFEPDAVFCKTYNASWEWLYYQTTPLEYKVASFLTNKAHSITNSLKPLSDDVTVRDLAYQLNISKSKVGPVINKLFELGVFGKFEVVDAKKQYTKYWILNPYLSFKGRVIKKAIWEMFRNTEIAKVFYAKKNQICETCDE